MLPPWGSLFFHKSEILLFFFLTIPIFFPFFLHISSTYRLFSKRYVPPVWTPNGIQSPKEEHHWRLGKYIWAGRFANYYAVCTSLPSHNCSFAFEFSWVFNFCRDTPFPHLHIAIRHLIQKKKKKKITFPPAKSHTACVPVPEPYFAENRRSWDLPGNTKIIKSSIKTWNSNELSRLLSQAIFLPESSQVGSQAQPCPARRGEGYQFWT